MADNDALEWMYLDSTGQEFGPFPGETMQEWFGQGYFPIGEELNVRLPSWKNHVALKMIYPKLEDAFVKPPHLPRGVQPALIPGVPGAADVGLLGGLPRRPGEEIPSYAGGFMMIPGAGYGALPAGIGMPYPGNPLGQMPPPRGPGTFPMYPMMPAGVPGLSPGRFQGRIKSFNAKQGFGFIECHEAHAIYGRDVFLHKAQIGDLKVNTDVIFGVEMNKSNMPQARDITTLDGHTPGQPPQSVAKGGDARKTGGGRGGGGGANAKAKRKPGRSTEETLVAAPLPQTLDSDPSQAAR